MSEKIPASLKRQVAERAKFRCEYCRLAEAVSFYSFHIDHIKSSKHSGKTVLSNLAYCCPDCNYFKGTDVATFSENDTRLVRFFNPRTDDWESHFYHTDGEIFGKTEIGTATERIFKFNDTERLIFRKQLFVFGLYP